MGYHNLSELIKVTELSERAGDVGLWNKPGINLRRAQTAPQSSLLITGHLPTCLNLTFSYAVPEGEQETLLSAGTRTHRTQKDLPAQSNTLQPGPTHISLISWLLARGAPLFSSPSTSNHHNFSESWQRTSPYSFKQPVIFISANLRVFMYRYKLCLVRYHHHLQTCPLKTHFQGRFRSRFT